MQTQEQLFAQSMQLHTSKAAIYETQNVLNEESRLENKKTSDDAAEAAGDAVEGFMGSAAWALAGFKSQNFNCDLHSKESLGLDVDPLDVGKTVWGRVPQGEPFSGLIYDHHMGAVIRLDRAYAAQPGAYDEPQYSVDSCVSKLQFVLANTGATSVQIDDRLNELGIDPSFIGGWNAVGGSYIIPSIHVAAVHSYSALFVRFVNLAVGGVHGVQDIETFGGNTSFKVDRVDSYKLDLQV